MTKESREALGKLRQILDAPGVRDIPGFLGAFSLNLPGETIVVTYDDMREIRSALDYMESADYPDE